MYTIKIMINVGVHLIPFLWFKRNKTKLIALLIKPRLTCDVHSKVYSKINIKNIQIHR